MSKESARKFYEQVKSDSTLGSKLASRGAGITDADIVKIAADAGFSCSADDLDEAGQELASELNDDALGGVSGGVGALASPSFTVSGGLGGSAVNIKAGIAASGLISCIVAVKASKL